MKRASMWAQTAGWTGGEPLHGVQFHAITSD